MPITTELNSEAQCRLCASSAKSEIIEIFGENGKTRNLAKKIEECLPISVSRGDCFPKSICLPCLDKLEQCYNFREECMKSEQSFEATWSNVHPDQNIEFSLEPECCLQEVEPEEPGNPGLLFHKEPPSNVATAKEQQSEEQRNNGLFSAENIPQPKKSHRGLADFIITPIMAAPKIYKPLGLTHESRSRVAMRTYASPRSNLPQVGVLNPDDYILMYEEQLSAHDASNGLPEYRGPHAGDRGDEELLLQQRRKQQVLPPMWDVYEKIQEAGETRLLHRRYIINKQAFPCSLCGTCYQVNQGTKREAMMSKSGACFENDINYLNNLPLGKRNPPNLLEIRPIPAKHKTALVLGKKRAPHLSPPRHHPITMTPAATSTPSTTPSPVKRSRGQVVVNTKHQFVSHMIKREPDVSDEVGSSVNSQDSQSFNDLVIKNFYCELCNKYFPRRSSLKRHQRSHLLDKMFPCPRCDKIFTRNEHLSRHLLLHTQARPFQCQVCMKKYTRKEHVDRHILIHPQIPDAEFRVRKIEPSGLEALDLTVGDAQPPGLQQKINAFSKVDTSPRASLLLSHRSYVCELCGHGFARKEHMQRHKRRMHTVNVGKTGPRDEAKPYSCPTCGKTFTRKEHLVRHNKIHLRESLLGLMSPMQDSLELTPVSDSTPEPPLQLPPLPPLLLPQPSLLSLVSGADGLDVSLSVVAPDSAPQPRGDAPLAPNKLDISISLVDEQSASSSDNLISFLKPFTCTFCVDKRFTRKSHLVRHFKRIHPSEDLASLGITLETSRSEKVSFNADTFVSNEEEHLCKLCNKHFSRRYHLNRHLKLHVAMKTGKIRERIDEEDKPFQCSSCRGRFHQYEGFQNHRCTGTEVGSMVLVGTVQRRSSGDHPVATRRRRSRHGLECERCGDSFATRKQLAKHKLTHRSV